MGDVADAILDGDLCQECGVYIGAGHGYPRSCRKCSKPYHGPPIEPLPKVTCTICGKRVKGVGLKNHQRDAHGYTDIKETK